MANETLLSGSSQGAPRPASSIEEDRKKVTLRPSSSYAGVEYMDEGASEHAFDALETPWPVAPELDLLRTQQRIALEDLIAGKSYTQAAHAAGVDRKTLYRWMSADKAFKAAVAVWRNHNAMLVRDRLAAAAPYAADMLAKAACAGNLRAAHLLLKGLGHLSGLPAQADRPAPRLARKGRILEMRLRELLLSLEDDAPAPDATPASSPPAPAEASDQSREDEGP
jgi:hypothetical protein